MPLVSTLFEWVMIDIVKPLELGTSRCCFILGLMDYTTWYPEAVVICNASTQTLALELLKIFLRVNLLQEILTDQGTIFIGSAIGLDTSENPLIGTSVNHPQRDGVVERFNWSLNGILNKIVTGKPREWNILLPYLLFAA